MVCLIVLHSDAYACRACAKMRSLNTESIGMNSIYFKRWKRNHKSDLMIYKFALNLKTKHFFSDLHLTLEQNLSTRHIQICSMPLSDEFGLLIA